jgi:hypothetical protein
MLEASDSMCIDKDMNDGRIMLLRSAVQKNVTSSTANCRSTKFYECYSSRRRVPGYRLPAKSWLLHFPVSSGGFCRVDALPGGDEVSVWIYRPNFKTIR